MKEKLKKLIDLKSIVTILLVCSLIAIIFAKIQIADEAIKTLFVSTTSSVFTYYFTRKNNTTTGDGNND